MRVTRRLAVLSAAGALALTSGCGSEPPPVSDKVAEYYLNPPTIAAGRTPSDLTPAAALLEEKERPWVLAVVGDSTGNESHEWVYLLAESMSDKFDRPVLIHNWSVETSAYSDSTTVGAGSAAPIVVWNGSASGKAFDYSLTHRTALAPQKPDLLILNHGHNHAAEQDLRSGTYKFVEWAVTAWEAAPAIAVTLQNPRIDKGAEVHAAGVASLRQQWSDSKVTLIDVWSAFQYSSQDVSALVRSDGFHPSPAGEVVWAESAHQTLFGN